MQATERFRIHGLLRNLWKNGRRGRCYRQMSSAIFPDGLNGRPFGARAVQSILRWAQTHPDAPLRLTTTGITGVIEIYPPNAQSPRWCLWQTASGRLQFDDLLTNQDALPYPTLDMALRFVALTLAKDAV
jgi:hypothetical protein